MQMKKKQDEENRQKCKFRVRMYTIYILIFAEFQSKEKLFWLKIKTPVYSNLYSCAKVINQSLQEI